MLYFLHYLAAPDSWLMVFNVLRYITFRAAGAAVCSFLLTVIVMPLFIKVMRLRQLTEHPEKSASDLVRQKHSVKSGTPTMGGAVLAPAAVTSAFVWGRLDNDLFFCGVFVFLAFGLIGFLDDVRKMRHPAHRGLSIKGKLLLLALVSLAAGLVIFAHGGPYSDTLSVPFVKPEWFLPHLSWFFLPWAALVLVACSNSSNLADGLDGLAGGLLLEVLLATGVLAYVAGHKLLAGYLQVPFVPQSGELAVLAAAAAGAVAGFLWFNAPPAEVFMGDTGSLALGALFGYIALASKHELVLPVAAGVLAAEAASVLLQIYWVRVLKRPLFRVAPLHHHFEALGWPESKIVIRLWLIGAMLGLASVALLKIR